MPKIDTLQGDFSAGELSPLLQGRTNVPRYKQGLAIGTNYIPTLQGPMTRRPGTTFMNSVKDSTKAPDLIPFSFSITQNYMLEFGDKYIRFYFDNGQVVTSGTSYQVQGYKAIASQDMQLFYATRANTIPQSGEIIQNSTSIMSGSILELVTPYAYTDLPLLRYAQDQDVIYLFHPNYPTFKLERFGTAYFTIVQVLYQDGPYLPPFSYNNTGDMARNVLSTNGTGATAIITVGTDSSADGNIYYTVTGTANNSGQVELTLNNASNFQNGDYVYVTGVTGTTEANTSGSSAPPTANPAYWVIQVVDSTHIILLGSVYANAWISGGKVYYGNFGPDYVASTSGAGAITGSPVGLVFSNGGSPAVDQRYYGWISNIQNACSFSMVMAPGQTFPTSGSTIANSSLSFNIGKYGGGNQLVSGSPVNLGGNGWPGCGCFHQNRLTLAGSNGAPLDVDFSQGDGGFEIFSPNPPFSDPYAFPTPTVALTQTDLNAFTVSLLSPKDSSAVVWVVSTAQGLLAGTASSEWNIAPSSLNEALTPSNYNPQQTSYYGSANIDAQFMGSAVMYVQRAQRKIRELNYYFQLGTFRSVDMTELSEHITNPGVTKLAVTKETQPLLWAIRSDGALLSMIYNRDDVSVQAGWTKHFLGGQSDANGTPPIVLSMAVIPSADTTFDQLWITVQRWINGSKVITIEYMNKIFDELALQQNAIQIDCAGTYNVPKTITGVSIASQCVVTAASHGFSNGQRVRIDGLVGVNISTTDVNGNVTITNLLNGLTFAVANATTNTFKLQLINTSTYVNSTGYGAYISGGQVRALVTEITGFTGFEGETFGVYADGGIHPDVVVNGSGDINLQWAAAVVQLGYRFASQGQLLRREGGSATGTSIGKTRRTTRVAFNLFRTATLSIGTTFTNLIPFKMLRADNEPSDLAPPLFSGIIRDGLESAYDFESQVCFQDNSPAPGMILSITDFMEEQDV